MHCPTLRTEEKGTTYFHFKLFGTDVVTVSLESQIHFVLAWLPNCCFHLGKCHRKNPQSRSRLLKVGVHRSLPVRGKFSGHK